MSSRKSKLKFKCTRKAIDTFTVANPDYPKIESARLFECWRCAGLKPAWHFKAKSFKGVLSDIVKSKTMTACDECTADLTERPAEPPRKRSKIAKVEQSGSFVEHRDNDESMGYSGNWMFEVQVMVKGHPIRCVTFKHVGYMKQLYKSRNEAANDYAHGNPDMRPIDGYSEWKSDWDPETRLRYVIRERDNVERTIECPWK